MIELTLDGVISLVSVTVVAQYAWSLRSHFSSPTMPLGTRLISVVVIATAAIYLFLLWYQSQPVVAQIAGLAVELAGLALFWAAIAASREARLGLAFNADKPDGIVAKGPYFYLRHPFYTSYLLFWTGWALAVWSLWTLLPLALIAGIYLTAARGEERKFSNSSFAADYQAYRQRTGFFWPRFFG